MLPNSFRKNILPTFSSKKLGGFTLIKLLLLAAIALSGVLVAVVLVSLGGARNKAKDTAIKADLSGLRSAAELYSMNNSESYANFCSGTDATRAKAGISDNGKTAVCNDSATAWAACSPIYNSTDKNWCVDSTGVSKKEPSMTCDSSWSDTVCP